MRFGTTGFAVTRDQSGGYWYKTGSVAHWQTAVNSKQKEILKDMLEFWKSRGNMEESELNCKLDYYKELLKSALDDENAQVGDGWKDVKIDSRQIFAQKIMNFFLRVSL